MTTVILVPGFKGSILAAAGKPVWITAGQALFGRASLAFDRPDLGVRNPLTLTNAGILDRVNIIPGLLSNSVYGSTVRALRAAVPSGWRIRAWQYDWRLDADALVGELDAFVASVLGEGESEVRIVAHSMGAMLTGAWLLREGGSGARERVTRAAFVAGAFRGTTKLFRNLQTGDDPTGRNRSLLSAEALGSFPSSYSFVPDEWPIVVDPRGEPIASDYRDVALWESERWGLYQDGRAEYSGARRQFFSERFATSRVLLRRLADPSASVPAGLRVHNALGTDVGTIDRLIRRGDGSLVVTEAQRKRDPSLASRSLEASGDGTIAAHSTELPPALAAAAVGPTVTVAGADHMGIVQKGVGLEATLRFISA